MSSLKNGLRRWSNWSLPTRLGLIIGVLGIFVSVAAWYWPDYWKRSSDERHGATKQIIPAGSEWREGPPKDSFTFERMDFPDARSTFLNSINDREDVVGDYQTGAGSHSFIRNRDGSFTSFEYPGSASTTHATGINNNVATVGFYYESISGCLGSPAHSFIRSEDGTFKTFSYPNAIHTFAHGINDKQEVVGVYEDCDGLARGFLLHSDGSFSPLDYPDAPSTIPTGINNAGEVVGHWRDPKFGDRGFLRKVDGSFISISPDPTTYAHPKGISNSGDIVGETGLGAFVIRKNGALSLIDHPACLGASCAIPRSINSKLGIVGQYQISSGVHGFMAKLKSRQDN